MQRGFSHGLPGLLAAGLSLAACSETPLAPTDETVGQEPVIISAVPDPLNAVPSTGVTYDLNGQVREYAFFASFDLILQGDPDNLIGISLSSDSLLLRQLLSMPVDGPGGGVDRERYEYKSRSDEDQIDPGGRISRAYDVWYTLPSGGREARITLTLNFVDDNGIAFERVHEVLVEP